MLAESKNVATNLIERLHQLSGRPTHEIRAARREFSKQLKSANASEVLAVAANLLETPSNAYRFVAYELILYHKSALAQVNARRLEDLGRGIQGWDQTDGFGTLLAGPVWRAQQISDSVIHKWARSNDRWWRRAALVATVPLNSKSRGGQGDARRTLAVCRMLESDRDPMVVKALSWALRALAKVDPQSVRRYVADRGDALPALVRREVRNKLTTGLKNPRNRRQRAVRLARTKRIRAGQAR
jgi:3-methyladenine DNA glycosylase AlkD